MEYWTTARAWAKQHTKTYAVWKAVPSVLATLMGAWLFNLQPAAKLLVVIGTLVVSYGVLHALEYGYNLLIRAPIAITNNMSTEILELRKRCEKPPRTAAQQYCYEHTQLAVQDGGEKIRDILRYLHIHKSVRGGIQLGEMARRLEFPESSKLVDILRQLATQGVIAEIPDAAPTGVVTWELPSRMEAVFDELLY
jgi:hypothetical protein